MSVDTFDPADEILESNSGTKDDDFEKVVQCLRKIALDALTIADNPIQRNAGFLELKNVLYLYTKVATSNNRRCRQAINVADELFCLLQHWSAAEELSNDQSRVLSLIEFFIEESAPKDVLQALELWCSTRELGVSVFALLNDVLLSGVNAALNTELSGSLLKLKHARISFEGQEVTRTNSYQLAPGNGIWRQMAAGRLPIDK